MKNIAFALLGILCIPAVAQTTTLDRPINPTVIQAGKIRPGDQLKRANLLSPAAAVPRKNGQVVHRMQPSTLINRTAVEKMPLSRALQETITTTPRGSLTDLHVVRNPEPALSANTATSDAAVYADSKQPLTFRVETTGYGSQQRSWVLQLASQPAPTHAPDRCLAWDTTPGLLASETLNLALTGGPVTPHINHEDLTILSRSQMRVLSRRTASPGRATRRDDRPAAEFPLIATAVLKKPLIYPATIYMRLVPLDAASHCTQPPSNWVSVFVPGTHSAVTEALEKKRQETIEKEKAAAIAQIRTHYSVEVLSYIPGKIRDDHVESDDISHYILLARPHLIEGQIWQQGATINAEATKIKYFTPTPSIGQQLWNLATGELNLVSSGYEAAKSFVVDAIASGINATGVVNCQATCRSYLKTGLEATLAYCGIPPSIPSVQALYDRGASYLAQNLTSIAVSEISGVDVGDSLLGVAAKESAEAAVREEGYQVARKGIDTLVSQMVCIDPSKGDCAAVADDPYTWGPPAPYHRARPAVLWLRIKRLAPLAAGSEKIEGLLVGVGPYYTAKAVYPITYIPADGLTVPVIITPVSDQTFNIPDQYSSDLDCFSSGYNGPSCGQPIYFGAPQINLELYTTHLTRSSVVAHGASTAVQWAKKQISGGFIYKGDHPVGDGTYYGETFMMDVDGTLIR